MQLPVTIRFVGLAPAPALEADIHRRITHIDRLCPGITAWRVTVEQEARRHLHGNPFAVRVHASLPGRDLTTARGHDDDPALALRDALDAIERDLLEALRIRRGDVKQHAAR